MRKDKISQIVIISFLLLIVFSMSIYYAVRSYTDLIDTEGKVEIEAPKEWDINFLNDSYRESDGSISGDVTIAANYITYYAKFNRPGQFYEFTIDVENTGYTAGILDYVVVSMEGDGLDYTNQYIAYDGIELHDGLNENINNLIVPFKTKRMVFRIEYIDPEDYHNLPHEDKEVKITAAFNYKDYEEE